MKTKELLKTIERCTTRGVYMCDECPLVDNEECSDELFFIAAKKIKKLKKKLKAKEGKE